MASNALWTKRGIVHVVSGTGLVRFGDFSGVWLEESVAATTRPSVHYPDCNMRYPCPCCGFLVFAEPPGSCEICPICFWEDDVSQLRFVRMAGGANSSCLIEAQQNYGKVGASNPGMQQHVRRAGAEDVRETGWRPLDAAKDNIEETVSGMDYGQTYPEDSTKLYYWRPGYWRR